MNWIAYIITVAFWLAVFAVLKVEGVQFQTWFGLVALFVSGGMYLFIARLMDRA